MNIFISGGFFRVDFPPLILVMDEMIGFPGFRGP